MGALEGWRGGSTFPAILEREEVAHKSNLLKREISMLVRSMRRCRVGKKQFSSYKDLSLKP